MFTESRHGALHVVRSVQSRDQIALELRKLDDRLFLEQQVVFDGSTVWCVVCDVGLGHPPITIMEWRDSSTGRPIPELTSGLVDRVAAMERDGARLAEKVIKANRDKVERDRQESYTRYRDIALDVVPRISGRSSAVLHRGQHLRLSRDKRRAKGENI